MLRTLFKKIAIGLTVGSLLGSGPVSANSFGQFCQSVLEDSANAFSGMYARIQTGPFLVDPWNAGYLYRVMMQASQGQSFSKSMFSTEVGGLTVQATRRHELFQLTIQVSHQALEDHAHIVFWDFIRKGGLTMLPHDMKGIVFQTQVSGGKPTTYFYLNLMRGEFGEQVPRAYKNLISDYRTKVFKTYHERLGLDEVSTAKLNQASEQTQDRTVLLIKTHQAIMNYKPLDAELPFTMGVNPSALNGNHSRHYAELPEHLEIESGVSLVYSLGPEDHYPFEIVSDMKVPRPAGKLTAEPGRLIIKKNQVTEAGVTDWAQIAAMFMGSGASTLHIQADGVHQKLFGKMGFQSTGVKGQYAGSAYEVMSIPTHEFLRHHTMAVFQSGAFDAPTEWMVKAWEQLQALLPHFEVPSVQRRIQQLDRELSNGVERVY
ncbi:MAG: hypothetical protein EOP09_04985 [Proteobacteria bacterium]|nr:MAG: hypothetical protein EOP09_04985 [Pseudomonadota bacterium]